MMKVFQMIRNIVHRICGIFHICGKIAFYSYVSGGFPVCCCFFYDGLFIGTFFSIDSCVCVAVVVASL